MGLPIPFPALASVIVLTVIALGVNIFILISLSTSIQNFILTFHITHLNVIVFSKLVFGYKNYSEKQ